MGFHPPSEEYLSTIRELQVEGGEVKQARLAKRLGYSAAAVSEMVKRLERGGLVEVGPRKAITLTASGLDQAESVMRRHRLAERLLTDVLGLDWHLVHEEAAKWEHVISDAVEARLLEVLGRPETCPHGNPIPGLGDARDDLIPLTDVDAGCAVTIERVTEEAEGSPEVLLYLGEHGLIPGAAIQIAAVAPDGSRSVEIAGDQVAVGPDIAAFLYVALTL